MNPGELWQNVARAMFFGFLTGIVFTILFMLASYTIVDTNLRAAIFEERIMNYAEQHPQISLLSLTQQQFQDIIITTQNQNAPQSDDKIGLRVIFLDPLTDKLVAPITDPYNLIYDPAKLIVDWFPATTSAGDNLKINYASSVTHRLYFDPTTKTTYLLEFQFISK